MLDRPHPLTQATPAILLLGCLLLTGCSRGIDAAALPTPGAVAASTAVAATTAPQALQTAPVPTAAPPSPGSVDRSTGPFDDRFTVSGLTLRSGVVTGELTVTSDVSSIIVMEVHSAFFDRSGGYLGDVVQRVERDDGAPHVPDERVALRLRPAASYAGRVSAARLYVPVLVNE